MIGVASGDARRAALYRQLADLEDAGIPLRTAVSRIVGPEVAAVGKALDEGNDAGDAWAKAGRFTPLEITVVRAGTKSGQLAECFRTLAEVYEGSAKAKLGLVAGLAYPAILIHLAFLLPNLDVWVAKGAFAYLRVSLFPILGLYAVAFVLTLLWRAFRKASPAAAGALQQAVPILGGYLRRTALAHGIGTLVVVYKAGVSVTEAVEAAASAATLFSVREGFRRIHERLVQGSSIGEAFFAETTFPTEVREAGSVGATTGRLDEQLLGAKRRLESEASTQKALLITIVPVVSFLFVALLIGAVIVSKWSDYFAQLDALTK
jgi:type II secretory pathway component PulF